MRFPYVVVAFLGIALSLAPALYAKAGPPSRNDVKVASLVSRLLIATDIRESVLTPGLLPRIQQSYFQMLDPGRRFLLQSDIDELTSSQGLSLDKLVKKGDMAFAFAAYDRYSQRVGQAAGWIRELVSKPLNYDSPTKVVLDEETAGFSRTEAEARSRWEGRLKYQALVLQFAGKTEEESRKNLWDNFGVLQTRVHGRTPADITALFLNSMGQSLDPHSSYYTREELASLTAEVENAIAGIGVKIESKDGLLFVKGIEAQGPAGKDGRIQVGDAIIAVGQGKEGELVDIRGMEWQKAIALVRGPAGSTVRVRVKRTGGGAEELYELVRGKVVNTDNLVKGKILAVQGKRIGVIRLPAFYGEQGAISDPTKNSCFRDVEKQLREMEGKVDGVVLDLQGNPGGLLEEAIVVAGLFLGEGPIVQVSDGDEKIQRLVSKDAAVYSGPLMVLIDKRSASASELVAGAIQDYGRGILVGDSTSFGKGSVQTVADLSRFVNTDSIRGIGALKVTSAGFFLPSGRSNQKKGVAVDVVHSTSSDFMKEGEAYVPFAQEFSDFPAAPFTKVGRVNREVVSKLKASHEDRMKTSPELTEMSQAMKLLGERNTRKELNFTRATFNSMAGEEKNLVEKLTRFGAIGEISFDDFGKTAYSKEALAIFADYLNSL